MQPPLVLLQATGLDGTSVTRAEKKLRDLNGIFEDTAAFQKMNGDLPAYEVDVYAPVKNGTEGGLFFGFTRLQPGLVGAEYFMTKGHFHAIENRAEYYWCTEGEGVLLLMDKSRNTKAELMKPGSLHYIPGFTAHRVVNTGNNVLSFGACWPADAGYDYDTIVKDGFSLRVKKEADQPALVQVAP